MSRVLDQAETSCRTEKIKKIKLGLNVDHVATLRQARGTSYPDPVVAALLAESTGCDSIVVHLREDRRHIRERDVFLIKKAIKIPLNLEMSTNKQIVDIAQMIKPDQATLVPEKRKELTTEGGLDLIKNYAKVERVVKKLKNSSIKVSLFIDPFKQQIKAAKDLGAEIVEFNTAAFVEAKGKARAEKEFQKVKNACSIAEKEGFFIAAGHGIDYLNVKKIKQIKELQELNIGHSIISRSVYIGLIAAVEEMIDLLKASN
ncbi:MAG: pyridoxine 5'-phosphate synthase [Candidatus Omnitrophica bacterium]|nr:pyridoxine 5'-phosphate synthase [Candidatus Omnitrophota bacterium]